MNIRSLLVLAVAIAAEFQTDLPQTGSYSRPDTDKYRPIAPCVNRLVAKPMGKQVYKSPKKRIKGGKPRAQLVYNPI
ncbi:MAG: hypothetical protein OXD45_10940 [Rhodobacteraceae bacterium]|nr:hypothetical protein [Paracoccaceae bacterium]MCY4309452.1 hypothetical protein [Paracoccaceae bacterium]